MGNEEIDLIDVMAKLWLRRKFILWFTLVCAVVGTIVSFILPRQYTAQCTLGLETEDKTTRISVEGMSAFQGMAMTDKYNLQVVNPGMYPDIFFSVPFQRELMYALLHGVGEGKQISFYDYFTGQQQVEQQRNVATTGGIEHLTKEEAECMAYLKKHVTMEMNMKQGYLKLTADMPEPYLAAGIVQQAQQMLQDYIARFRVAKAQSALDFIEGRYQEVKNELENKQQALLSFRQNHRTADSIEQQAEEKVLMNDYELFFGLYSDIVRQREKVRMQVKEKMPVLTMIGPVVMPSVPSKPIRGLIILAAAMAGLLGACFVIMVRPLMAEISGRKREIKLTIAKSA